MTLKQAIAIIEGIYKKEVTAIRYSDDRTRILFHLDFEEKEEFLEL